MAYLTASDLAPFAEIPEPKAAAMIEDAVAQAILAAPCLSTEANLTSEQRAAVRAVLRSAVLRWHDAGSGAFVQQTTGPFSAMTDTRQARRSLFWPSEISQLQMICTAVNGGTASTAFSVDTVPSGTFHDIACSMTFGAYCSCGADIAGHPIYGTES